MARKLFVVRFSEKAEYIMSAIEEFIASNVSDVNIGAIDYKSLYDIDAEKVFDDKTEAREYFNTIQNVLIDMGYEFSVSNNNVIIIDEPVKEEYITFETIWVTSEKVPAWAIMYDNSVKGGC